VCNKKVTGSRGRAPCQGAKPRWTWNTFSIWTINGSQAANLAFRNAKCHRGLCCLAKIWSLIGHILACVWLPEGTLSPSEFLLRAAGGQGHGGSCPLPLAPPTRDSTFKSSLGDAVWHSLAVLWSLNFALLYFSTENFCEGPTLPAPWSRLNLALG